jgi:hypothetical protein
VFEQAPGVDLLLALVKIVMQVSSRTPCKSANSSINPAARSLMAG